MLEHLILIPRCGLCNRIRAIASARRVCAKIGARCSVCWRWGDYHDFFEPESDVGIIPSISAEVAATAARIRTPTRSEGGDKEKQRIPTCEHRELVVESCHVFNAIEELRPINLSELKPFLIRPSRAVAEEVRAFRDAEFRDTVGFHMRRTDNWRSKQYSPDELFLNEAQKLVDVGHTIFLATDNIWTANIMSSRFGRHIIIHEKRVNRRRRWPRPGFSRNAVFDDMVDLFLLASCRYVVGSFGSSYSTVASVYNGSPHSFILHTGIPASEIGDMSE